MPNADLHCNEAGLDIIRRFEGLRLEAYRCPAGRWTIGFGHTGRDVHPNSKIDEHTAEVLLMQDVTKAERLVRQLVYAPLNENQFSALVSMCFNLGGALRGSKSLRVLNRKQYLEFADRMLLWNKARDKNNELAELPGLTKRRQAERELFLTPVLIKS